MGRFLARKRFWMKAPQMLLGPRFLGGNPLAVKPEEGLDAEVNDALDTPSLLNMSSTCFNSCVNR